MLGEARQHGVACPGPTEGTRQGREHRLECATSPSPPAPSEKSRAAAGLRRLDEGEGVLGRRRRPGVGQRRGHHRLPRRRARPPPSGAPSRPTRRRPRSRSPSGPGCTPLVVVVFRAKRTSAWLVSSTSTMQPSAPGGARRGHAVLDELLGGDHPCPRRTLSAPTPRACSGPARRARAPTGSRARPVPPVPAGPCRS